MSGSFAFVLSVCLLAGCSTAASFGTGTLVVANQGDGTVSFVDLETFEVSGTIEVGNGPHEATADPESDAVFISMYGRQVPNDQIVVIDPEGQSIEKRIPLAPRERPHGIVWRDGSLFVTAERSGEVLRLDRDGTVTWVGETGGELGHMVAVSSDGSTVYTGNMKTNDVSAITVDGGDGVTIPVGKGPEGIALSPDDRELWVAHRMGGGLSVIDTSTNRVVANPGEGIFSARLSFSPDGTRVLAYDMPTRNVVMFDRATRKEIGRYQPEEGIPVNGLIGPDSRRAYVIRYQPDAIFELDLETLEEGRTVETGSMPDGLAIVEMAEPRGSER